MSGHSATPSRSPILGAQRPDFEGQHITLVYDEKTIVPFWRNGN